MHYLTVQDVLWIHLQISKKPAKFNYAKLEEAVNYQYAYGKSKDVLAQASQFFIGFQNMSPFEGDNRAVALVAGVTFLQLNGFELSVSAKDLSEWFARACDRTSSKLTLETGAKHTAHEHHATTRQVAKAVLDGQQTTIKKLLAV